MKNVGIGCIMLAVLSCGKKGRDTWVPNLNALSELYHLKKQFPWQQQIKNEYQ